MTSQHTKWYHGPCKHPEDLTCHTGQHDGAQFKVCSVGGHLTGGSFQDDMTNLFEEWHTDHLFENGKCSSVSSTSKKLMAKSEAWMTSQHTKWYHGPCKHPEDLTCHTGHHDGAQFKVCSVGGHLTGGSSEDDMTNLFLDNDIETVYPELNELTAVLDEAQGSVDMMNALDSAFEQVDLLNALDEAKDHVDLMTALDEAKDHVDLMSALDDAFDHVDMMTALDDAMDHVDMMNAMDEAIDFVNKHQATNYSTPVIASCGALLAIGAGFVIKNKFSAVEQKDVEVSLL